MTTIVALILAMLWLVAADPLVIGIIAGRLAFLAAAAVLIRS